MCLVCAWSALPASPSPDATTNRVPFMPVQAWSGFRAGWLSEASVVGTSLEKGSTFGGFATGLEQC